MDGIGAWIKRTVRQDSIDHRPEMKTVLTSDKQILSPAQVAEHLPNESASTRAAHGPARCLATRVSCPSLHR